MLVTDVAAALVRVPLEAAVRTGTTTVTDRDYVVARLSTDAGLEGVAWGLARGADLCSVVKNTYGPHVLGRDPQAREVLWRELRALGDPHIHRSSIHLRALSLVDIALWDLASQAAGCNLSQYLGAKDIRSVPALAASGYYSDAPQVNLGDHYKQLLIDGYSQFKIMIGGLPLDEDAERVNEASSVLPGNSIALDPNCGWERASEALEFMGLLDCRIDFIEEPFHPDNTEALRDLRNQSRTPIAIGEYESGTPPFIRLIDEDLVDIVRVDATVAGGISEWLMIAEVAGSHGLKVLPHYFPELHAHLVASTPYATSVEVIPVSSGAENFSKLLFDPPKPIDGSFPISERRGLGLAWNWEVVEQHTIGRP